MNIYKILIFTLLLASTSYAQDTQRYVMSIEKMVADGTLSEQEGKEQIVKLKIEHNRPISRSIASTLIPKKVIKFSNDAIEIQAK